MVGAFLAMLMSTLQQPYSEPLRPQFHFTAQKGWLNDPNGLVFFKGEYHLFFQHNPFGTEWGNMTWGHAVSKDLVHWRQLDEAIEPDKLGTIFSGSAVVDALNTAGFGKDALVCVYTAAGGTNEASKGQPFTQCLAYSLDGRSFTKFSANPVLGHQVGENRDPKVIWHGPSKRWVMALYLDGDRYGLFSSPDLKAWTRLSEVRMPGTAECPDFFELPLDGDRKDMRWVFWGANGNYRVGHFDGKTFTPDTDAIGSHFGNTSYAAQTYFNDSKGRRVQVSWFNNANFPGTAWNQQMGFPAVVSLRKTPHGPRLTFMPVEEIRLLRARRKPAAVKDGSGDAIWRTESGLWDIDANLDVSGDRAVEISVDGRRIVYDGSTHRLEALGSKAEILPADGRLQLRILVDRASIEIYAQQGLVRMSLFALPTSGDTTFRIHTKPAATHEDRISAWELNSAWR